MDATKQQRVSFLRVQDLRTLLSSRGPCLTIYLPLKDGKQERLGLKGELRNLEGEGAKFGQEGKELLSSVLESQQNLLDDLEGGTAKSKGAVIFKSLDFYQVSLLNREVKLQSRIGPHFHIRPLLSQVTRDQVFFLLALSQKNTRLLRCTLHDSEEIAFPSEVKTDFDLWMNQVKPDHIQTATTAIQGSIAENSKNEYLSHYFKQIDRGVNEILRGKSEPLVLCGVEYELPRYRKVNRYPHLCAEEVRGAANSLKAGEMHVRALEAIEREYQNKIDAALTEYNHRVGTGASNRLKEVIPAAHDGRILTLLLSDSLEQIGAFDETTHQVKGRETGGREDEDLLNDAAVQTILHDGHVLVTPNSKMPNGSPLAAIFRF